MNYAPLLTSLDRLTDRLDSEPWRRVALRLDEAETIDEAARAIRDLLVGFSLAVDALAQLQASPNDPRAHRIALDTLQRLTPPPQKPALPAKDSA